MREDRCSENIELAQKLNLLACKYIDENDLDSAIEKLTEALRLAPGLAEPHTNLGVLLLSAVKSGLETPPTIIPSLYDNITLFVGRVEERNPTFYS